MAKRPKKNKEAGEEFKKLLREKRVTQYKLEQLTGLDKSVISKIATGQTANPTPTTLVKIADALGVELGQLTRIFEQSNVKSQDSATHPQPQKSESEVLTSINSDFVGREEDIAHLNNLVDEGAKVILIQAEGGIGKTTLARKWFEIQGLEYLELRVGTTPQNLNSIEDWVRLKLRDYFQENPEQNFMTMLEQFKSKLQNRKIGLLIDNLESALINGEFIAPYNYLELLTLLADNGVRSVTLITSREPIYEHILKRFQNFKTYVMKGLKQEAWQQYFEIHKINIDNDALSNMHLAYGGNAEVMYILSGDILTTSKGSLKDYWQKNYDDLLKEPTLKNLVKRQFDKLQQNNPQAYNLLCRLGCYRYQYVPVIPETGIYYLLWDEQNERNKPRIIIALRDRTLVKFSTEGYYLYEVIRQEAIERLELTDDFKKSHAEAGIFLSTLISNHSQAIIPKITYAQNINDNQEQMYLNIENAEQSAKQELTKHETLALEVIYHAMEFYDAGCFEELRQEPKVLNNPFFQAITNMIYEYVDSYNILAIALYKFALSTQILGILDQREGKLIESSKEFEYCQKSWKVSQSFFQTALLITERVKEDKLMNNVLCSLADCLYYRGISLHQLGIFLHRMVKYNESTKAFNESKLTLEKALQIFTRLSLYQQIEEVKKAIHSLEISQQSCNTSTV